MVVDSENMLDYYIQCKKYYTERLREIDKELYVTNLLQLSITPLDI